MTTLVELSKVKITEQHVYLQKKTKKHSQPNFLLDFNWSQLKLGTFFRL